MQLTLKSKQINEKYKKIFEQFYVNVNTYLSKQLNFSDDDIFKVIECLKLNNEIVKNLVKVIKTLQQKIC